MPYPKLFPALVCLIAASVPATIFADPETRFEDETESVPADSEDTTTETESEAEEEVFSDEEASEIPDAPLTDVPADEDTGTLEPADDSDALPMPDSLQAWENSLDAIYTPDAFDPPIPVFPEQKSDPKIEVKRDAFKTKLRTVSKFKEKAKPEEIDKWFADVMPTPTDPLALSINAELRREISEKLGNYERVPVKEVFPHPSAKFFPGDVPEKFKRIGKTFYPDPKKGGWQSTGLYAAPGERVKVRVSKSALAAGLRIRIGSHSDNLLQSRQRYWYRFPKITRDFGVHEQSFEIASAFGGLIYVSAPRGRISARTQMIFSGVVEAPFFELDETKASQWNYIRYAPAPWAEFVGKNFAATIPAEEAAAINNPEEIIRFWDNVVAELDKLTAGPKERAQPIRFVVDVETNAAAGHAGDPIVGNRMWSRGYWDLEQIRKEGSWELFHALAKNVLNGKWVFRGDRDTPAALLALYSMEKTTGRKAISFFDVPALQSACLARLEREETEEKNKKALRERQKHEELEKKEQHKKILKDKSSGKGRREREKAADEADVEDFRHDPGVPFQRLAALLPIIDATGWDPLAKVFKLYTVRNRLPLSNEEDKQRTFVMLWSQTTKKNLSPHLEKFDFPKQNGAGNYPDFVPETLPEKSELRPEKGGTGFLGYSPFPTIAVLNENYRVPQLPKPEKTAGNPFGSVAEESDEEED